MISAPRATTQPTSGFGSTPPRPRAASSNARLMCQASSSRATSPCWVGLFMTLYRNRALPIVPASGTSCWPPKSGTIIGAEKRMIRLTDDQRRELDRDGIPSRVFDPQTNQEYVLIQADLYDRLKSLIEGDANP